MPPANEITGPSARAGGGVRASSAPMIWALREKSPDQSMAGARSPAAGAPAPPPARSPAGPGSATNVPWPTWARATPAAHSSS